MKNNSNIYDIDGEIIRRFDDVHRFTALEATNIQKKYNAKIQELYNKENRTEEDEKKLKIYETYCKNLQHYIFVELQNMNEEQIKEYYAAIMPEQPKTTEEDINKALEELKNDVETGEDTEDKVSESAPTSGESTTNEESRDDDAVGREQSDIHEKRSVSQSDLLVERDGVVNNMDEYVSPIGEASDEYVQFEELPK